MYNKVNRLLKTEVKNGEMTKRKNKNRQIQLKSKKNKIEKWWIRFLPKTTKLLQSKLCDDLISIVMEMICGPESYVETWFGYNQHRDILKYGLIEYRHQLRDDYMTLQIISENGYINATKEILARDNIESSIIISGISGGIRKGYIDFVKLGLQLCMDCNDLTCFLDAAAAGGHLHIVKLLISLGAKRLGNAIEFARRNSHSHILKYIKECILREKNDSQMLAEWGIDKQVEISYNIKE